VQTAPQPLTTCAPPVPRGTFRAVPSPPRHPLELAIFEAWCRQNGLDPAQLRRWMAGTEQVSREVAEGLRAVLGVPIASWKLVEPAFRLRSRRKGGTIRSMRSSAESVEPGLHVENRSGGPDHPFRPGRKLATTGPISKAVRNAKLRSREELARQLGYSGEALRSWDRRGGKGAPQDVKERLSQPPYDVPLTDWAA
jgi:hypothetical protein